MLCCDFPPKLFSNILKLWGFAGVVELSKNSVILKTLLLTGVIAQKLKKKQ